MRARYTTSRVQVAVTFGFPSRSPPIQLLNRMMECSMGILGRPWLMSAESMRLQNFGRPSNTVSLK